MNETRPKLIAYAGLAILAVAALLVIYVQGTNRPDTAGTTMSVSQPEVQAPVPVPTWTPTAVTVTTVSPTSTPAPVQVANTPVPAPDSNAYTVRSSANLRGGPGTNYRIVGSQQAGDSVQPIGRTEDAQWLELVDEHWIYAPLVDGESSRLPITRDFPAPPPQPTVAPPTPTTVVATPSPTPHHGGGHPVANPHHGGGHPVANPHHGGGHPVANPHHSSGELTTILGPLPTGRHLHEGRENLEL